MLKLARNAAARIPCSCMLCRGGILERVLHIVLFPVAHDIHEHDEYPRMLCIFALRGSDSRARNMQ